jgi:hypothetical protein
MLPAPQAAPTTPAGIGAATDFAIVGQPLWSVKLNMDYLGQTFRWRTKVHQPSAAAKLTVFASPVENAATILPYCSATRFREIFPDPICGGGPLGNTGWIAGSARQKVFTC